MRFDNSQVKWSRKNIAATMERFEPTATAQSSSSTSSLDYGFAAGVMTPGSSSATPSHGAGSAAGMSSTASLHVAYNGGSGAGGAGVAGGVGGPSAGAMGPSGSAGAAAAAPFNHVYSYAYYEPGAAKCHTNVPAQGQGNGHHHHAPSKSPPRNSIRALLAKSFRSKSSSHSGQSTSSSPSAEERDRHTYTTRYGTTENLYEEVSDQKIRKVLSDNRIATSSVGNVKEELRRVQHNHFRVLDELNLSLEALIMPPTPPDISPSHGGPASASSNDVQHEAPATSTSCSSGSGSGSGSGAVGNSSSSSSSVQGKNVLSTGQRPRRGGLLGGAAASAASNSSSASHASLENLSSTLNSMELKDHAHSSCINPEFDEGDLDSGFSGSGSSSSSTLPHNLRSCRSSTASGTSTSKSSMASCGEDQGIAGMGLPMGMGMNMGMGMPCPMNMAMGMGMPPMNSSLAMGMGEMSGGSSMSPFNYPRRCSADQQRSSGRSIASATGSATGGAISVATGAKPKKNFWTMKP
ncbi:protein SPT2 homolog [Drosophila navojoa]|uniref:protein SPT2 homolog n=1 Tax=Drosophila navojoa TaxID=7232 RepID=UPI0011BDECB1|nr:protein SPT2 homolog [Drosophila navojoa]